MAKKNIIGIIMIILILAAFAGGYLAGKRSAGKPESTGMPHGPSFGKPGNPGSGARPNSRVSKSPNGRRPPGANPSAAVKKQIPSQSAGSPPQTLPLRRPAPGKKYIASVQKKSVSVKQAFYGTVTPHMEANVQSKQGGTITYMIYKEGDSVKKGEIIVRFDSRGKQLELEKAQSVKNSTLQQVEQAQSNYITVQKNFQRTQSLFNDGLVAKQELDTITNQLQAESSSLESAREIVKQAETQVRIIKNSLKDFQVKAAISGSIDKKMQNINEIYRAGEVLYHIINIDKVYAEIEIPETYLRKIYKGMKVTVFFNALGDKEFPGMVETILSSGEANNRNFTAKILVPNPDHSVQSGMFARIEMAGDETLLKTQ